MNRKILRHHVKDTTHPGRLAPEPARSLMADLMRIMFTSAVILAVIMVLIGTFLIISEMSMFEEFFVRTHWIDQLHYLKDGAKVVVV